MLCEPPENEERSAPKLETFPLISTYPILAYRIAFCTAALRALEVSGWLRLSVAAHERARSLAPCDDQPSLRSQIVKTPTTILM
jgi:hypothetical protein